MSALERRRELARMSKRELIDIVLATEATLVELKPEPTERDRIAQSNEVAGIVFDQVKLAWPDLHPVLHLRYGIADALWTAGYRRETNRENGSER